MKKMFLSLAAIAFVATGALTVTSCGSDDSTTPVNPGDDTPGDDNPGDDNPGDDNPGEAAGVLTYNGSEFDLDNAVSQIYGHKNQAGNNVISAFNLPINQGQDTITVTRWNVISFNGEDANTSENYYQLSFYIEVDGTNVVAPNAAEKFYLAGNGVLLYAGNSETPVDLGQLSSLGMEFNTFEEGQGGTGGTIDYVTSITGANGTVESDYNGGMDGTFFFIPSSPKGITEGRIVGATEKVDLRTVKLSDKAVLVTE